jgi:FkbM family methyltransferase
LTPVFKKMHISQLLFDSIVRLEETNSYFSKLSLRFLKACRKFALHLSKDERVFYRLHGTELSIPLSHNLPYIKKRYPDYSTNVARIATVVKQKYPELTLIDIGANIGDTVAILRASAYFPILCIDGDRYFYSILCENARNWPDVVCINSFVGNETKSFVGKIESVAGTAHLLEDLGSGQRIEMKMLSEILRENRKFANAKMIKVDTDGFDCKILKSELELLKALKPVLFFEYDPYFFTKANDDGFKIFSDLKEIGYGKALIFENTGEYLIHVDLRNVALLEDIHEFYSGWSASRYCDVCIFHDDDSDLFIQARQNELAYFKSATRI